MKIKAVDPEKLKYAFELFNRAAEGSVPGVNPADHRFSIDESEYRFTDIPMNRGMLAVVREFKGEDTQSMGMRIFALLDLLQKDAFPEQTKSENGEFFVSDSLVEAVARAGFSKKMKINRREVQRLIAQHNAKE